MNPIKLIAVLLLVAGVLALVYGGFSYPKSGHEAKLGSLEFSVGSRETVNVPVWAGIGALVLGGVLLMLPIRK